MLVMLVPSGDGCTSSDAGEGGGEGAALAALAAATKAADADLQQRGAAIAALSAEAVPATKATASALQEHACRDESARGVARRERRHASGATRATPRESDAARGATPCPHPPHSRLSLLHSGLVLGL